MKLSRIILFGQNISGLKLFYQSVFNLPLIEEIEGEWLVFDCGGTEIAFHLIGEQYRTEASFRAESNTKIVFNIDEDMVEFREQLIAKGLKMREIKTFEGYAFIFCDGEDIEGNVFQLCQKKL